VSLQLRETHTYARSLILLSQRNNPSRKSRQKVFPEDLFLLLNMGKKMGWPYFAMLTSRRLCRMFHFNPIGNKRQFLVKGANRVSRNPSDRSTLLRLLPLVERSANRRLQRWQHPALCQGRSRHVRLSRAKSKHAAVTSCSRFAKWEKLP